MDKITRRSAITRTILLAGIGGWASRMTLEGGVAVSSLNGESSTADASFGRLRQAGERQDLRLLVLDEGLLRQRVKRGVYAIGSLASDTHEEKAEAGLIIEEVLRRSHWRMLSEWRGGPPALILIKKHGITLGGKTREFLGLPVEAGDVLIVGLVD